MCQICDKPGHKASNCYNCFNTPTSNQSSGGRFGTSGRWRSNRGGHSRSGGRNHGHRGGSRWQLDGERGYAAHVADYGGGYDGSSVSSIGGILVNIIFQRVMILVCWVAQSLPVIRLEYWAQVQLHIHIPNSPLDQFTLNLLLSILILLVSGLLILLNGLHQHLHLPHIMGLWLIYPLFVIKLIHGFRIPMRLLI